MEELAAEANYRRSNGKEPLLVLENSEDDISSNEGEQRDIEGNHVPLSLKLGVTIEEGRVALQQTMEELAAEANYRRSNGKEPLLVLENSEDDIYSNEGEQRDIEGNHGNDDD
ncbi:hypothetical protein FRX31_004212 [Thalictrum thalictroides]|uniref:Uncharacterized protein n=1 Tax=Thalictrum thalictroides TaxID=46969 RepID=A0A7J6X8T8_THATH|nr:hypothetical protein FRX31_004212 [Thalictrum thalictroides]